VSFGVLQGVRAGTSLRRESGELISDPQILGRDASLTEQSDQHEIQRRAASLLSRDLIARGLLRRRGRSPRAFVNRASESAKRSIARFSAACALLRSQAESAFSGQQAASLPEYAIITPVPPQQTGIADYTAGLIHGLRSLGNQVTVFTQSRFAQSSGAELAPVYPLSAFKSRKWPPQRTIYQLGNNTHFHDEITLHFLEHGGIAHIHDLAMHHLFAYFTFGRDHESYYALISKWYGAGISNRIRNQHDAGGPYFWANANIVDYPLNEEVIAKATGVIVHSEFSEMQIRRRFRKTRVYVVPQRYPGLSACRRMRGQRLRISSLGFVDQRKRVDSTISAIAMCRDRGVEIHLDVVGRLDPSCAGLPDLCRELQVDHLVKFWGFLPPAEFGDIFAATDLCVALRDQSVGETSAIAARAVQYGVPLIVNDVGSFSELPPCTIKIPPGSDADRALADHLYGLATDGQRYADMANGAYEFGTTEGSFAAASKLYSDAIHDISLLETSVR
jgi:glycosyltransferase involved in cell wall biosynthesis